MQFQCVDITNLDIILLWVKCFRIKESISMLVCWLRFYPILRVGPQVGDPLTPWLRTVFGWSGALPVLVGNNRAHVGGVGCELVTSTPLYAIYYYLPELVMVWGGVNMVLKWIFKEAIGPEPRWQKLVTLTRASLTSSSPPEHLPSLSTAGSILFISWLLAP